ncbi:MAG TPA: phage holin family protein [Gaiellaceae bacterium]
MILRFAVALGINAAALWLADAIFSSVRIDGWKSYVIGAAVLGIANGVIKPVLAILTLPLIIVTLGFFLLVINIAMVALAEWAAPNFSIDGFWTYVGTVVIIWLVNWIAYSAIDELESPRTRFA